MMISYKNIVLSITNSFNGLKVSNQHNPYADSDAQMLACSCQPVSNIIARNGKKYYYFSGASVDTRIIQYLLNCNGVLAYRRYSWYNVFYDDRRPVVRVPLNYVVSHPQAHAFIKKVISMQKIIETNNFDSIKYLEQVENRMHQR